MLPSPTTRRGVCQLTGAWAPVGCWWNWLQKSPGFELLPSVNENKEQAQRASAGPAFALLFAALEIKDKR